MFVQRLLLALLLLPLPAAYAEDRLSRDSGAAAEIAGDPEVGQTDWEAYDLPTDGSFSTMGDAPPDIGLVQRIFELSFAEPCEGALSGALGGPSPEFFDLSYRATYDDDAAPPRAVRLYRFFCNLGAYNVRHVYMTWEADWGLRPVLFSEPELDVRHEDDNDADGPVVSLAVTGFTATPVVVNSWYDPASQTITTASFWRGLGDASSSGVYAFHDGEFVLRTFDVDASYDGEINPFRVVDHSAPTPVPLVAAEPVSLPEGML